MSQFEQIAAVDNLTKLHLPVSKSLLTQEIWLRVGLIQCTIALDASIISQSCVCRCRKACLRRDYLAGRCTVRGVCFFN